MAYQTQNNLHAQNSLHNTSMHTALSQHQQGQNLNMLNSGAGSHEHSVLYEKFIAINSGVHGEYHYALETLASSLTDIVCYPYKREVKLQFFCLWQGKEVSANITRREDFTMDLGVSLLKPVTSSRLSAAVPYLKLSDTEFTTLTLIFADVIAQRSQDHKANQHAYGDEIKRLQLNKSPLDIVTPNGWAIDDPFPGKLFHSQARESVQVHSQPKESGFWSRLFGRSG